MYILLVEVKFTCTNHMQMFAMVFSNSCVLPCPLSKLQADCRFLTQKRTVGRIFKTSP